MRKAPAYAPLFWVLFLKVAANLGDKSKQILEASTPEAIDALRTKTVRVVVQEGTEFLNVEVPLISAEIRAMVDNICYMSVYGHRTMFEKISPSRRAAFYEYSVKMARDCENEFYESWKSYRAENPVETVQRAREEDSETERLINVLMGDDGPDAAAAVPACAAAAEPAAEAAD